MAAQCDTSEPWVCSMPCRMQARTPQGPSANPTRRACISPSHVSHTQGRVQGESCATHHQSCCVPSTRPPPHRTPRQCFPLHIHAHRDTHRPTQAHLNHTPPPPSPPTPLPPPALITPHTLSLAASRPHLGGVNQFALFHDLLRKKRHVCLVRQRLDRNPMQAGMGAGAKGILSRHTYSRSTQPA